MTDSHYLSILEFWNFWFEKLSETNFIFGLVRTGFLPATLAVKFTFKLYKKSSSYGKFNWQNYVSISFKITCNQIVHFQVTENVMKYHCIWSLRFLFFLKYHQNERNFKILYFEKSVKFFINFSVKNNVISYRICKNSGFGVSELVVRSSE